VGESHVGSIINSHFAHPLSKCGVFAGNDGGHFQHMYDSREKQTSDRSLTHVSTAGLKEASKALADSCMAFYDGDKPGGIPGLLPPSSVGNYNWWQSGALWGQVRLKSNSDWNMSLTEVPDD